MRRGSVLFAAVLAVFLLSSVSFGAELGCTETEKGFAITVDGRPFTELRVENELTPNLWPIFSPGGELATRIFPNAEGERDEGILKAVRTVAPFESRDHSHHRSMWFHFGDVNGVDFWNIRSGSPYIRCREVKQISSPKDRVVLKAKHDWIKPGATDQVVCSDVRTLTFGVLSPDVWFIDFDVDVLATDHDVTFGDTKEGMFAIRVPGTIEVDAKSRNPNWGGVLINAEGVKNADAWSKRSRWVDYSGPVYVQGSEQSEPDKDGPMTSLGLTVMNHPQSFRYPSWWHVRTYGLLAANPFALTEFQAGEPGKATIKPGESFLFRYRILIHEGLLSKERIEEFFDAYAEIQN